MNETRREPRGFSSGGPSQPDSTLTPPFPSPPLFLFFIFLSSLSPSPYFIQFLNVRKTICFCDRPIWTPNE